MKAFLITNDADTCVGMRLAGIDSVLVNDKQKAEEAFDMVEARDDIGVLLFTEQIKHFCPDRIYELTASDKIVSVEIPDSQNVGKTTGSINDYIRETIGIHV